MLHLLQRQLIPIVARFRSCLVLTYAFPERDLQPLLPPGLTVDACRECGFVALALVQTEDLRPAGWPRAVGRDFCLAGLRIFTRFRTLDGRRLRGLRIIRSYTDRRSMALFGNLLTHYRYQRARVRLTRHDSRMSVDVAAADGSGELSVAAYLDDPTGALPEGGFFESEREARRFAGPLPHTFDYEPQTHSIVVIRGVRENWSPRLVRVEIRSNTFLQQPPLDQARGVLSSAFYLEDVPYRWERGVRETLGREHDRHR